MRASVARVGRLSLILLLLAGHLGAKGSDIELEKRKFEKGQFLEITVVTFPHTASQCYLITPLNTEIDLLASEPLPDKYEYLPNTLTSCRVRINDLDENDRGLWSLHAIILSEDNIIYELKEQVNVTFEESETSTESESSEDTADSEALSTETSKDFSEENKDSVEASQEADLEAESLEISSSEEEITVETLWLTNLQLIARTGLNMDVNIPRTLNNEKCTLTKPDGSAVDLDDDIPGVTPRSRSVFVSCRVVVGPMDASLLGRWTLCGSYVENNVEHRRCQIAEIVWNTPLNPDSQWQISTNSMFNHPVHFGGTLSPLVRGSGTPVSCHLVTPNGEDLYVTRDREYPDIRLTQISNSMCGIAIGPIAELHLGEWTIYGMFRSSSGSVGYHGVQQPFTMELYDVDNPYAQAYNVTNLSPIQHVINLGTTITVDVTGSGVVEGCQVTIPSGETYLGTDTLPTGVTFVVDRNIRCRLSIGPITEDMLGEWLLNGKFSNRNIFTETRLNFTIIQEDPQNPIEEDRAVEYLAEQVINTDIGLSNTITIDLGRGTVQSCHIRTPEGLQYTFMQGFNVSGVEQETGRNVACGVTIRVSEDMIGTWTLIARERTNNQQTERRQPFVIFVEDEDNPFVPPYNVTYLNPTQHVINLGTTIVEDVTGTGVVDECQFMMPSGETYLSTDQLPNDVAFVVDRNIRCRLSIGPITENMLGEWLLIGQFSNRNIYTEFRLNFQVIQEDPWNPIEEDRAVEYLAEQFIITEIGISNTITIDLGRGSVQSCHIRTPEGLQYTFMEGFNVPGVEQETGRNVACGVTIRVSENMNGTWTLIARERTNNQQTERRQPFVIFVADEDNTFVPPYDVTYLNPIQHVINLGTTIAVEVNGTGVVDESVHDAFRRNISFYRPIAE